VSSFLFLEGEGCGKGGGGNVERSGADDVQGETEVLSVGTDSWAEIETAEGFGCWVEWKNRRRQRCTYCRYGMALN
jgi:hypothetical protein